MSDKIETFIITTEGRKVELQPVSQRFVQKILAQVQKEFEARKEPLTPPGYWAIEPDEKGQGGEWVEWDAASVEKDGTPEEQAAWKAHEEATERLQAQQRERSTEVMLLKGIKNEHDRIPSPEWVREQETWGLELPTEPRQLQLEYIQTEVLKTPLDIASVTGRIAVLSVDGTMSREDIDAMENSFRLGLVERTRAALRSNENQNGTQAAAQQAGELHLQPAGGGYEGGAVVGDKEAVRMGQPE